LDGISQSKHVRLIARSLPKCAEHPRAQANFRPF
jgi:hypothetical protein